MDTRSKILTAVELHRLAPAQPLVVVSGYFDVLRADHLRELSTLRSRAASLAVQVLPLENELLPRHSRAELVAALRMVDYVLITELNGLEPFEMVHLEAADALRIRHLIEHVRSRQT